MITYRDDEDVDGKFFCSVTAFKKSDLPFDFSAIISTEW